MGVKWDSKWIQYSMLGTKKLAMGSLRASQKEQMSRERPLNLLHNWQAAGEVGWADEDEAEGLLKTTVEKGQRMG